MLNTKEIDGNDSRVSLNYPNDNVDMSNEQELTSEETSYVNIVPKDKGWAWMCCLGEFFFSSCHYILNEVAE